MRCELTLEQAGLSPAEIAAIPTRRTWYGIVGSGDHDLDPRDLTQDAAVAKARCLIANTDLPSRGPWHVVTLTENLRVAP